MQQSFVTTLLHNDILSVPALQGKRQGFDIRILTQGRFPIVKARAKSKVLTSRMTPGDGPYRGATEVIILAHLARKYQYIQGFGQG